MKFNLANKTIFSVHVIKDQYSSHINFYLFSLSYNKMNTKSTYKQITTNITLIMYPSLS